MYPRYASLVIAAFAATLTACGSDTTTNVLPGAEPVVSAPDYAVTLADGTIQLTVGEVKAFTASSRVKKSRTVRWSSSNTTVATVSSTGTVTAKTVGTALVTATASNGAVDRFSTAVVSGTTTIASAAKVASVLVNVPATTMTLGAAQTATATARDSAGTVLTGRTVTWSVSSGTSLMVNASGVVTALAGGTESVVATIDGVQGAQAITVATVTSVAVSPKTGTALAPAQTRQFTTVATWSDQVTRPVSITYTATGGTISTSGLYTAGQLAGTFLVIANCACGRADTAAVSIVLPTQSAYTGVFGPGKNAPAWSGKTEYPEELFNTPVPAHYAGANSAGFKGWQGFDGAWGITYKPTRVSYPFMNTPLGSKRVLDVTFPGSSQDVGAANMTSAVWPTNQAWGVRVTGSWSGTLVFERSTDGVTWTPVSLVGARAGSGTNSLSGSQTDVNGVWISNDALTADGGSFRVRSVAWTGGTATIAVGMQGGGAAARMTAGSFIGNPTRIYTRVMVYVDASWTDGGNTGTKFVFFSQQQGNNHYTSLFGNAGGVASVGLQQTSSRNILGTGATPNGTWMDVEMLFVANTPGVSNGLVKVWVNGVETTNASDVMFFAAGKIPGFSELFMDPTYGGGMAPPPRNVFFRIAGWYRESAP